MKIPRTFTDFPSTYAELDDLPDDMRLGRYESEYADVDVWAHYFDSQFVNEGFSEVYLQDLSRMSESWKQFCQTKGCHHGFASPKVVDGWCADLLQNMSKESARNNYLTRLNNFYRYLMWHVDYPHCYNPVQFAVRDHQSAHSVWDVDPWRDCDV